ANQQGNTTYAAAPQAQRTIAVTLRPQSISFTAPASGTTGGSAALAATASSGLPVTLSVDPATHPKVCTLDGTSVYFLYAAPPTPSSRPHNRAATPPSAAAPQPQRPTAVTLTPQSLPSTAPASGTTGGSAALAATASSGLPVTLSVDPATHPKVCTLDGTSVYF